LIESLIISLSDVKQEWLADDSAVNGKVESLYNSYKHLNLEGNKIWFSCQWVEKLAKSEIYRKECKEKVSVWRDEIETLANIAEWQPHAAIHHILRGIQIKVDILRAHNRVF
jgi:hypothetical protein